MMITIQMAMEYIDGVRAYGSEIPTTEAKAQELVKNFHIAWYPTAKDSGWLKRGTNCERWLVVNPSFKFVFIKKAMH